MTLTTTNDIFADMRLSYLDRLDGKIAQIEAETERALSNVGNIEQNIAALYGSLHKLIGSAGIYGFLDISDAAGAFIDWVRPLKADPQPLNQNQKQQALTFLEHLKEASACHLV